MPERAGRLAVWAVAGGLVVLCTRAIVYALNPTPLALHFERAAGGPGLPLIALVAVAAGLALACGVLAIAATGVRERRLLDARPLREEPRLRPLAVVARAAVLFAVTSVAFALLESTIHWRAGLGWHGVDCLVGPVHRDAIPLLAALSLVAAAVVAALQHVLGWMRRTLALLRGAPRLAALRFGPRSRPGPLPRAVSHGCRSVHAGRRSPPVDVAHPYSNSGGFRCSG